MIFQEEKKMSQILTNLATTHKLQGFGRQLRFDVTFYSHLVYSPCSEKSQSRLSRTFPSQILKFPRMDVSSASLGNLFDHPYN